VRADEVKGQINRFTEADREKLDILTKRIINKLLHIPTIELRKAAENDPDSAETMEMIAIIREMFGLDKKDNE
jgi:glutamyl-tRNA reductase